jgi:integrase
MGRKGGLQMDGGTGLGAFLDMWLGGVVGGSVRHNTYTAYGGYIENHIKPFFGEKPLEEIGTDTVQRFVRSLGAEGKGLAAKTVRVVASVLSGALQCAVDYGYIVKNPCARVRLPKIAEKEIAVFTQEEQRRIERAAMAASDKRAVGIVLCLYTGIRLGELCALQWEQVDFKNKTLCVRYSLNRTKNKEGGRKTAMTPQEPKSAKSKRVIPLPNFLCGIVKGLRRESPGAYVLSMPGGKFVHPRTVQLLYAKLLKTAGVPYHSFHALRHTFATRAIELGADIKTVSEILGHANASITINRYVHSLGEQKRKMMNCLDALYLSGSYRKPAKERRHPQ